METPEAPSRAVLEQMFWKVCAGWYREIQGQDVQQHGVPVIANVHVEE
jgi:hypothetical protein